MMHGQRNIKQSRVWKRRTQILPPSMGLLSYGGDLCSSGMLRGIG